MAQTGTPEADTKPLSIFAAAVKGPLADYETSVEQFFGSGIAAAPAEVAADRLSDTIAPATPTGAPATRCSCSVRPMTLAPGRSVTLRYVYGMAHPSQIPGLVAKYRAQPDPLRGQRARLGERTCRRRTSGAPTTWVARELEWDAYLLRSATVYEEACGYHTITQGGYYQYSDGHNLGYRSWPHYLLPMVYSDPELARQILEYAVALQPPPPAAQFPYGTGPLCSASTSAPRTTSTSGCCWPPPSTGSAPATRSFFDE